MKTNEIVRKDIPGYPDHQVTTNGNIFNKKKGTYQTIRKIPGSTKNYLTVVLSKGGKSKQWYVSQLVANAFVPNPEKLKKVTFIDSNSENVVASNLRWATQRTICKTGRTGEKDKTKSLIMG